MKFLRHRLKNGLEIVAEENPHALSTAIGFFVRAGARDETPELAGVSHFLEHMAFKGSERRSADDVNREFDEIGAKYNAYTTEEHTVYHAAVLPEYLERTVDLLGDLLLPSLRSDDFHMEKKVIVEEIQMYADKPMWSAFERAMRIHFLDHPLGNSVLGTKASVESLTPEAMRAYYQARYVPGNIFVAAAGKLDFDQLVAWIDRKCGTWAPRECHREIVRTHRSGLSEVVVEDRFVQECLFLQLSGPAADHPGRIAAELLAYVIGDDTGSRFHWALADPGDVETVDFGYHEYEGLGCFLGSASCTPAMAEKNLQTMKEILAEVTREGVTAEELTDAKNKLAAAVVLAGERPYNRLSALGYNWSYRHTYRTIEQDLDEIHSVSLDDIRRLLEEFPLLHPTTLCLGPVSSFAEGIEV